MKKSYGLFNTQILVIASPVLDSLLSVLTSQTSP